MTRHHFAALFFAAALGFGAEASAYYVTPLPGSTPQHAAVNQEFPNAPGVRVTEEDGRPVVGARVTWIVNATGGLKMNPQPACAMDAGSYLCAKLTDADGVAVLPRLYGTVPGNFEILVWASVGSANVGQAYLALGVDPRIEPHSVSVVSGANQQAVFGTAFAQPFIARLTRPDGSPVANTRVNFKPQWIGPSALASFLPGEIAAGVLAFTDAAGYATSGTLFADWGVGRGTVEISSFDASANATARAYGDFFVTNARGEKAIRLQDMWWSGPAEGGWGMSIAQHGDDLFAIVFAYDAAGKPTWYSMSAGIWVGGVGKQFNGSIQTPVGTPFYAYDVSKLRLFETGKFGWAYLSFEGESRGRLLMDYAGRRTDKLIERFDFSQETPSPITGVGDLWWGGPGQSGWGVSIMEQKGGLFSIWFTYDDSGNATWFAMTDGAWTSSNTYEGRMYRTTGSPWLGAAYDVTQFRLIDVGPYKLRFLGPNAAELEYNVEGRTGTLSLTRTPFGSD